MLGLDIVGMLDVSTVLRRGSSRICAELKTKSNWLPC